MGIEDRHYYRDDSGRPGGPGSRVRPSIGGWSINTWLIVINIAIFVAQQLRMVPIISGTQVLEIFGRNSIDALTFYGHFSSAEAFFFKSSGTTYLNLEVWRLLTFQFLHDQSSIWHVGLNMFGLYIFGGMVEQYLGRRRYLAFYMICGICGGLTYLILNGLGVMGLSIPGVLNNDPRTPLVGASAGVFGVILACAYIAPNARIMLIFPPIPLPLKVFAYGYVGVAVFNLLVGGNNAGGDAAHIGGAIAGAFFIRNSHLLRDFFNVRGPDQRPPGRRVPKKKQSRKDTEIDRILEKVNTQGLQSLSEKEKRLLRKETEQRRDRS